MRITLVSSAILVLLATGFVKALPPSASLQRSARAEAQNVLLARQAGIVSPDGTCGNQEDGQNNGYRCPATSFKCCSRFGHCGDTSDHCGTGCQPAFGICTGSTNPPDTTPSTPITSSRPKIGNVPYGVTLNSCTVPGTIALTFDDGPYIYTQELLDRLNSKGVKATFFMNGHNWGPAITDDPTIQNVIRNAYNAGHQIASHTWSHLDLNTLDSSGITSQMTELEDAFLQIIGRYPTYMRPPYFSCGATCLSVLGSLGYHVITANIDTLDWQFNTPTTIWQSQQIFKDNISSTTGSTGRWIELSHDVHETTVEYLAEFMIDTATQQGYRLVTVGECMSDAAANWYRTSP